MVPHFQLKVMPRLFCVVRSVVLDEMGDKTPPTERLAYFSQFEGHFSGGIDFVEYVNVSRLFLRSIT